MKMEYTVTHNIVLKDLITNVNNYIKDGWQPQGGICCGVCNGPSFIYFQALIRNALRK